MLSELFPDVPTRSLPDFSTVESVDDHIDISSERSSEALHKDSDFEPPPKIHKKGASFLSLASSDDHHDHNMPEQVIVRAPPPPPINVQSKRKPVIRVPPPVMPIPLPPPAASYSGSLRTSPTSPTSPQSRRRTLTPSSPTTSDSDSHLLTPTGLNPIALIQYTNGRSNAKALKFMGIENESPMSLSPPPSPVTARPTSWASPSSHTGSEAPLRSSASFTAISAHGVPRRSPSRLGPRGKAMSLLGIGDLPPSGSHYTPTSQSGAPLPPLRSPSRTGGGSGTGSVRKFFRALTGRKANASG
ncbi:hypothetical protein BDZ89DRAFT_443233 [Hymenopellis radicata]|nr:hypothetical protein BDZ89DRAFT_443233 [Hymenopellis radicata]